MGWGCHWYQVPACRSDDIDAGLAVAAQASSGVPVQFLVVDFARTRDGRWIVIECIDARESGYVGIPPQILWRRILDAAAARPASRSLS